MTGASAAVGRAIACEFAEHGAAVALLARSRSLADGDVARVSHRSIQGGKVHMPERDMLRRAMPKKRTSKKPTTQAGEFVREEMHHIREGKHGARSTKQAIAIGLSKARRAGVQLRPPPKGKTAESTRSQAKKDYRKGQASPKLKAAPRRSRATLGALQREGHRAASRKALSQQAHRTAHRQQTA